MSTDTTSAQNCNDIQAIAMLSALAGLLRSEAFMTEYLDTLVAVDCDTKAGSDALAFAGQSLD